MAKKLLMMFTAVAATIGVWAETETVRRLHVDVPHQRQHGGEFGIICGRSEVEYCN